MKKYVGISVVFITLFIVCSVGSKQQGGNSSSMTAYGIEAAVTEVFDNYCTVKVIKEDRNFNTDSIITVYYDGVYRELDETFGNVKKRKK